MGVDYYFITVANSLEDNMIGEIFDSQHNYAELNTDQFIFLLIRTLQVQV